MTRSADYMQSSFSATKWAAIPPCGTPGPGLCAEFWPRSRRGVLGSESQFFSSHVGHQKCQHAFFNRFSKFCSTTYRAVFGSPWGPRDPWIGLGPNTQNGFGLYQGGPGPLGVPRDPTGPHGGPKGRLGAPEGSLRGPKGCVLVATPNPWRPHGAHGSPMGAIPSPFLGGISLFPPGYLPACSCARRCVAGSEERCFAGPLAPY